MQTAEITGGNNRDEIHIHIKYLSKRLTKPVLINLRFFVPLYPP